VCTLNLRVRLNLETLAADVKGTEYNPTRFAAAILRTLIPTKATCLAFSSGKLVITGAKDEDLAWEAVRQFHSLPLH